MFSKTAQDQLQAEMDKMVDDTVVFKLHDGPAGPAFADNLMFGDGLPQEYTYSEGGELRFVMPELTERVPLPRQWWQLRMRYVDLPKQLKVHEISMWSRGLPVMLVDRRGPIYLTSGGVLTLCDIARPTIS